MVVVGPVEAAARDHEYPLGVKKIHGELLVACDIEALLVQLREAIQRAFVLNDGKARDLRDLAHGGLPLLIEAAAGVDHLFRVGAVFQRGRNDKLSERVAAKPHGGQLHHALHELLGKVFGAAYRHPAAAESADHVGLGKAVESNEGNVVGKARQRCVLISVHDQAVVDLVRQNKQVLLPRQIDDLLKKLFRIQGAGGVVGVYDDDAFGFRRHLALDVLEIRAPFLLLVADVEDRFAASDKHSIGPEGIARTGNQNFIAGGDQDRRGHGGHFRNAVADEDVVRRDALYAFADVILGDRFPGGLHAAEIAIGDSLVNVLNKSLSHALGQLEAESRRIAGVEAQNFLASFDHLQRFEIQRSPDIGVDVFKRNGFDDRFHIFLLKRKEIIRRLF